MKHIQWYKTSRSGNKILHIIYTEKGQAYSDFAVQNMINEYKDIRYKTEDQELATSTENVLYAVRVAIYKDVIDHEHVKLTIKQNFEEDIEVKFDEEGRPDKSIPDTFVEKALCTLIGLEGLL